MILRTILHMVLSRRRTALGIADVGRIPMRVVPTDLDVLGHMNNGVYFSIMDLGRMDLLIRSGLWATLRRSGCYPVMVNETMTFRRSLQPWQRFVLETRVVGYDEKSAYIEQRFVVDGEVFAQAVTRGRFLRKSGGTVSMRELSELTGTDVSTAPPAWVLAWVDATALPSSRQPAPSTWV